MVPEIKARWIEALRSGQYEQGFGQLNLNNKYCCLGVLCELAVNAGAGVQKWERRKSDYDDDGIAITYAYGDTEDDASEGLLPLVVIEWSGIRFQNPQFCGKHATELNDVDRRSFAEIADLIEADEYL